MLRERNEAEFMKTAVIKVPVVLRVRVRAGSATRVQRSGIYENSHSEAEFTKTTVMKRNL